MITALHDNQYVAIPVLCRNVPGLLRPARDATDADAVTLPERVIHETLVPADDIAIRRFDRTRLAGRYRARNDWNGRSPMKQIPVLSLLSNTGKCRVAERADAPRASSSSPERKQRVGQHRRVDACRK